MRRLVTHLGGHPTELDDLDWMQDGVDDAVRGLLSALIPTGAPANLKLSGIFESDFNSPTNTLSAGWVLLEGLLYYFPATVVGNTFNHQQNTLAPDLAYDTAGDKIYEDGTPRKTYQIRRAKVEFTGPATDFARTIYGMPDYRGYIREEAVSVSRQITIQSSLDDYLRNGWRVESTGSGSTGFYQIASGAGMLTARLVFGGSNVQALMLPVEMRPFRTVYVTGNLSTTGSSPDRITDSIAHVTIASTGQVYVNAPASMSSYEVSFTATYIQDTP